MASADVQDDIPYTSTTPNYGGTKRTAAELTVEDIEHTKKTRRESDAPSGSGSGSGAGPAEPKRGSKRSADAEDDGHVARASDKRARKVSLEHAPRDVEMADADASGEEDASRDADADAAEADDELMDLETPPAHHHRGRKRDRAEAGSSFGADEDELAERRPSGRPERKRRAVRRGEGAAAARGKKRERDGEDEDGADAMSVDGGSERSRHARKKRGKKGEEEGEDGEEVEMDVSVDPMCGGRTIGEEWESHGLKYKVGPNGQRLRLELVKKVRTKFMMVSVEPMFARCHRLMLLNSRQTPSILTRRRILHTASKNGYRKKNTRPRRYVGLSPRHQLPLTITDAAGGA